VKAVGKFKALTAGKRPPVMSSILGDNDQGRFSLPPAQLSKNHSTTPGMERSKSLNADDRKATETALVAEGVHRDLVAKYTSEDQPQGNKRKPLNKLAMPAIRAESDEEDNVALARLAITLDKMTGEANLPPFRSSVSHARTTDDIGRRGHARDPLEEQLYLRIGPSTFSGHSISENESDSFGDDIYMVSESPGAADVDIYETAYRDEIERILAQAQQQEEVEPQVYLTRRVDEKLLQLSGLAGKLMAHGEEAKSQIKDYTQFGVRKARVTEVSRALREAARDEYVKRRQERKAWIEAAKVEKAEKAKATDPNQADPPVDTAESKTVESPGPISPKQLETTNSWKMRAVDRGRQAKTSVRELMGAVKKGRKSKDDET